MWFFIDMMMCVVASVVFAYAMRIDSSENTDAFVLGIFAIAIVVVMLCSEILRYLVG